MSYTALYRNFRPQKFSEMVGQDHITRTLKNQIILNRVGHAYLFCGGRGTGKTTSAKILARAVNCLNPQDGEPCNECEICKEILNGSLTDVVEMDAASNTGVDDIRIIKEEVNFLPTKAKYRVYIIDEAHMLSLNAFNALLKTLEEPPSHVKFILATTEPQKMPMTILSRCQRFDYKKIPEPDIIKRLKIICDETKIEVEEEALKIMATLSEGHMRDAISILERCVQESQEKITVVKVRELVGLPSLFHINKLAKSILEYNVENALQTVDEVITDGKDLYNFLWELIKYFKDVLVFRSAKNLKIYSEEEIKQISELANIATSNRLLDIIYLLSDLENDLKWSSQKTIMFQTGIIKACRVVNSNNLNNTNTSNVFGSINIEKNNVNTSSVVNNANSLNTSSVVNNQNNINTSSVVNNQNNINTSSIVNNQNNVSASSVANNPNIINKANTQNNLNNNQSSTTSKSNVATGNNSNIWPKVIAGLRSKNKIRLFTALASTNLNEANDMVWEIRFPNGITAFNQKVLDDVNNRNELINEIFRITGKQVHLKFIDLKNANTNKITNSSGNVSNAISNLGIDINIID